MYVCMCSMFTWTLTCVGIMSLTATAVPRYLARYTHPNVPMPAAKEVAFVSCIEPQLNIQEKTCQSLCCKWSPLFDVKNHS